MKTFILLTLSGLLMVVAAIFLVPLGALYMLFTRKAIFRRL